MIRRPAIGEWTKVLVDEQFRKCVTFLYADRSNAGVTKRVPVGSAFFVAIDVFEGEAAGSVGALYVVTARHVVDGPHMLWLRMRKKGGGFVDLPASPDSWEWHPSTDIAAAPSPVGDFFDVKWLTANMFATEDFVRENAVGEGDDVFFSGLFVGHYGEGAPQPIIRFGNVALMPRERVRVEISRNPQTWADIEAYLVEARSWGGQSGSPAFLSFPPDRQMGGGIVLGGPPFALLGLVQGIWKDPEGAKAPDPSGEGVVEINMGISVVVPAYKVLEVLMEEPFITQRAEMAGEAKPGSLKAPEAATAGENPEEFERFERLTRNLVNTPKSEVDEKRKDEG